MNTKVLITGGAGFIGSHLAERLLQDNYEILIIDDFNDFYDPEFKKKNIATIKKNPLVTVKKGDITNIAFVQKTIQEFEPTHIVHLAARAGVRPSLKEPELYTRVNVLGTVNILEAAKNLQLKNFVFASSSSVYGENKKVPFSETDNIENQISPYAITKRSAELVCRMYAKQYNIPTTCLRFFTVYGPRQRPDLAIRIFMTKMFKNQPITMFGKGDTSRDYTYIDDIVDGIYKSLHKPFKFEIINLGNSSPITLKELVLLIEKTLGKKAKITQKPIQPGDVSKTYADISKAKKLLNWSPKTTIEEGLRVMANWMKTI